MLLYKNKMLSSAESEQFLEQFPEVAFAFAYGSGAVTQAGYQYSAGDPSQLPLLDAILVVEDSAKWHEENMLRNPTHYTPLLPLSAKYVASFQDQIPAHLWFNTYVMITSGQLRGRMMKYGVINKQHMLNDLCDWVDLYVAGRLQKPVHILKSCKDIETAMKTNLESAVRASLLMLPERFNEIDLYLSVASLSYVGDPRMYFGENPKKVRNLVTPIVGHYQALYQDPVRKLLLDKALPTSTTQSISPAEHPVDCTLQNKELKGFVYEQSPSDRWSLCLDLPLKMRRLLQLKNREKYIEGAKPPAPAAVRTAVSAIVARSASMQTIKGMFMVGMFKGTHYFLQKVKKRFGAR